MREFVKPCFCLGRLLALLGWLWWGGTALAQAPFPVSGGHAEDLYSDLAFDKVWVLQEAHRYEESVPEIRKIIAANPGTELEAAAMVRLASTLRLLSSQAARHGNALLAADLKSQSDALWQQMVDRFPGTKYWLNARAELLQSPEAYHALLEEVGGPSYEAVRSGQLLRCDGEAIPLQYRQYVKDAFEFGPYGASFEEEARFRLFFLRSFPEDSTIWGVEGFLPCR